MPVYSGEFRRQVLSACDAGVGTRVVATKFNVSESWVRRIKQERREQGKLAPLRTRRRIPKWAAEAEQIEKAILQQPDLTLRELKDKLGTTLSVQTLCRALQRLRLTLKKSAESLRAASARRGPEARRVAGAASRPRSAEAGVSR